MERNNIPFYKQIKEEILKKIEKGEYKVGDKIPSISELSKIYNVSNIVVRQALGELVKEGYLEGIPGKGTFVKEKREEIKRDEKLVGLIFTEMVGNPFFAEIFTGIESVLSSYGYHMVISVSYNIVEREKRFLKEYMERGVRGIIITPTEVNRTVIDNEIFSELQRQNIPVIFVDRKIEGIDFDYISSDNVEGGYIATKYLISLGHKRIGIILGINANTVRDRLEGYKKALQEYDIIFDPLLVRRSFAELQYEEAGYNNTMDLLHLKEPPTAIFACNEAIAIGIYRACFELGLNIPDDLSVIGYDNLPFTSSLNPPLTTINQKKREMGEEAARILISRINGDKSGPKKIIFKTELIERNSCKQLKEEEQNEKVRVKKKENSK
ncbi:MAG TPA: GntR family transcriptional regulator [bacterium]|nr:GntR family transcriptional regulator [bacterium]HOM27605.1 GntR family transcriptional regulator [bacterium]